MKRSEPQATLIGEHVNAQRDMGDKHLTYVEVEQRTGIKKSTLYHLVARQEIPHVRVGRRIVRFPVAELERWLRDHLVCARAPAEAQELR